MEGDKEFQQFICERDVYCMFHGIRPDCMHSPISAHHIETRAIRHKRHDKYNGIGLCVKCHQWVHAHPTLGRTYCVKAILQIKKLEDEANG